MLEFIGAIRDVKPSNGNDGAGCDYLDCAEYADKEVKKLNGKTVCLCEKHFAPIATEALLRM